MTSIEAAKASWTSVKGDEFLMVSVADHKTALNFGAEKLVMGKELGKWFEDFRDVIRPQLRISTPAFFITPSGNQVTNVSSDIGHLFGMISETRSMAMTAVRKATATLAAGSSSDTMRRNVAVRMCHSDRTADT